MTASTSNRFDSVGSAGASTGLAGMVPVVTIRAPASTDIRGPYGSFKPSQIWVDTVGNDAYILVSLSSSSGLVSANWQAIGGDAGTVNSIAGTANQISASGATGSVTLSIPSSFSAPGSITAAGNITSTGGNIQASGGNIIGGNFEVNGELNLTSSSKIFIPTGAASSAGQGTMANGTLVIATTAVTANSLIFYSRRIASGTLGELALDTITPGTGFTILSTEPEDATFDWFILN